MKKLGTLFMLAGLLLIVAALCLIGKNYLEERDAGKTSEAVLDTLQAIIAEKEPIPPLASNDFTAPDVSTVPPTEVIIPDYVLDPNLEMPEADVDDESFIGTVEIPSLGKNLPIISEWSYKRLKKSPCRYQGSAYLDDLIIIVHNYDTHFGDLKNMKIGDRVKLTDMAGNVFLYEMVCLEMIDGDAVEAMNEGDWDLTLFTCTIDGGTRVTVRCKRISR